MRRSSRWTRLPSKHPSSASSPRTYITGGKLVIPAGTEIHGTAQTDHQRERIASGNSWTLIWQNGMEMQIKAIALDREFENDTNQTGWAITDGSAGLRGEVIKSDNLADIKLICRDVPVRRGQRVDGKTTDRLRPHQQSHAQQRALRGRAGGAANLRPANLWIRFKRMVSTSACRAENNFISTSCKPLTPPTPRSAAPPFPSPRKTTNNPNQNHENVLSHSTVVSLRVFHHAEVDIAATATARRRTPTAFVIPKSSTPITSDATPIRMTI